MRPVRLALPWLVCALVSGPVYAAALLCLLGMAWGFWKIMEAAS
jgi:hypothetical protein